MRSRIVGLGGKVCSARLKSLALGLWIQGAAGMSGRGFHGKRSSRKISSSDAASNGSSAARTTVPRMTGRGRAAAREGAGSWPAGRRCHHITSPVTASSRTPRAATVPRICVRLWTAVAAFIAFKIADLLVGLRVPEEDEREGLDTSQHGERAYS